MESKQKRVQQERAPRDLWAIRGVDLETRNAAKIAARKSGQTLGEWVNRTLREAATADIKAQQVPGPTIEQTLAKLLETMSQQNAAITARLEAVEQRERAAQRLTPANPFAWLYGLFGGTR